MQSREYKKSFTLLETIVAIYVFLLGIVGAMTLANSALSSAALFKDQLTASSLAQEGEELVRSMRDSQYLARLQGSGCYWPLCDANDTFAAAVAGCTEGGGNKGCRFVDPFATALSLTPCDSITTCRVLKRDSTLLRYQYSTGTDTKFDRRIFISPSTARGGGLQDWQAHVIVTWPQRFGQGRYEVTTQLTPWVR